MRSPRAMCAGGAPIYDPQVPPGSRRPQHDPRLPVTELGEPRKPFDTAGTPWTATVVRQGAPLTFGPFPTMDEAMAFMSAHRLFGYSVTPVFPPGDAVHIPLRL